MGTIAPRPTGEDVTAFLDAVPDERRRADAAVLEQLVRNAWRAADQGLITAPTGISPARVPDAGTDPVEISAAPTTW